MSKKGFIFAVVLVLVVLGGWLLFRGQRGVQNAPKQPLVASEQPVQPPQTVENPAKPPEIQSSDIAIDTSTWKVYLNKRYGFEIKYPDGWSFEEREDSGFFDNSTVFRYIKFRHLGGDEYINFGLKKETETSVVPREFNTGISGGDFVSYGTIRFGEGVVEEKHLVDCYFKKETGQCTTELIQFCKPSDCGDFSIGSGDVAFLEAREIGKVDDDKITDLLHGMITSFRFVR